MAKQKQKQALGKGHSSIRKGSSTGATVFYPINVIVRKLNTPSMNKHKNDLQQVDGIEIEVETKKEHGGGFPISFVLTQTTAAGVASKICQHLSAQLKTDAN